MPIRHMPIKAVRKFFVKEKNKLKERIYFESSWLLS
jgi:hypothetical protein